jgi:hypothetical protein
VDDNAEDKNDNLPQASDIEGVEEDANDEHKEDTLEHQKYISHSNTEEDLNKVDNSLDNDNNSYDSEEQEDMAECMTNDEHQRIHYVTKSGRNVKTRKDLLVIMNSFKKIQKMLQNLIK